MDLQCLVESKAKITFLIGELVDLALVFRRQVGAIESEAVEYRLRLSSIGCSQER